MARCKTNTHRQSRRDYFNAGDETALANFTHSGQGFERLELGPHLLDFRLQLFEDIFLLKILETRLGRGATERVSGVAVTVSQRFAFRNGAVEAREYFVRYDGHRQRQIASAQSLSQHLMSGMTDSCSLANIFPARPKPVITSSTMSSAAVR